MHVPCLVMVFALSGRFLVSLLWPFILVFSHACAGVSIWASISQKLLLIEMRFGNVSSNFQTYDFVYRFIPVASQPLTRNWAHDLVVVPVASLLLTRKWAHSYPSCKPAINLQLEPMFLFLIPVASPSSTRNWAHFLFHPSCKLIVNSQLQMYFHFHRSCRSTLNSQLAHRLFHPSCKSIIDSQVGS
jgi:hypothetical protein